MSIDSTRARPVATERRLSVPWLTVLTFYAVGSATALTWAAVSGSGASLIIDIQGHAAT